MSSSLDRLKALSNKLEEKNRAKSTHTDAQVEVEGKESTEKLQKASQPKRASTAQNIYGKFH